MMKKLTLIKGLLLKSLFLIIQGTVVFTTYAQLPAVTNYRNPNSNAYDLSYQAVLDYAYTQKIGRPSIDQQAAQNNFLKALKTAGIWSITDHLKVLATNGPGNFTDINWANPGTNNSTRVAGPLLVRNNGYKFNGVDSYLNTAFVPSSATNYILNSAECVVYYRDISTGLFIDGGRDASSTNGTFITPSSASTQANAGNNSSTTGTVTNSQFDTSDGLYFFGRTSSSSGFIRKGSNSRVTYSNSSTARTAVSFKLGVLNTAPSTFGQWNTRKCLLFWAGGVLTTTQEDSFKAAWDDYLNAVNADPGLPTLGSLYNKSSWSDLSDFTNTGVTASIISNQINITAGSSSLSATLALNRYTCLEKWKWVCQFTVDKTSGAGGIGFGVKSANTSAQNDVVAYFSSSSTINSGLSIIASGLNGTYTNRALTSALTYSSGDKIELIFERNGDLFTVTSRNVTTSSSSVTVSYTYPASSPLLPNTSRFALYAIGHTTTVNSMYLESSESKNAKFVIVGDSKICYYYASKYNLRASALLSDYTGYGVALGGGSDKSADMLNRVQEIIDLAPEVVILCGASNDPRFGVASATTNANYASLVSTITAAGIRVIHTTGFYETSGVDQTGLQTYINANYSSLDIIPTLSTVIGLNADGIHPNDAGFATWVGVLINSNKISY